MRSAKPPAQLRRPPLDAEIDDGLVSWISHMPAGSSRKKLPHFLACAKQGAILLAHCGVLICNDSSAGRGGADSRVRRVYEPNPSTRLAALRQILLPPEDRASAERRRGGRLGRHEGFERRAARAALQAARPGVGTLQRLDFLLAPEPHL